LKSVLLVYSSNRYLAPEFEASLLATISAGVGVIKWEGSSDVTFARNISLSKASEALLHNLTRFDTVLMVDDDIVWSVEQAQALVDHTRKSGRPASGCYIMKDGRVAAHFDGTAWQTGLGFLAIPSRLVLDLYGMSRRFKGANGEPVREFTKSGVEGSDPDEGEWKGEDYWLTRRLGGVDLLPISVGHIKPMVLQANPEKLAEFIEKHSTKNTPVA
jgi:hypothetical protein